MNLNTPDLANEMAIDNIKAVEIIHKEFIAMLEISIDLLKNAKAKEQQNEAEKLQRIEASANLSNSFQEILNTRDQITNNLQELVKYVSLPIIELDEEQEITEENTAPYIAPPIY